MKIATTSTRFALLAVAALSVAACVDHAPSHRPQGNASPSPQTHASTQPTPTPTSNPTSAATRGEATVGQTAPRNAAESNTPARNTTVDDFDVAVAAADATTLDEAADSIGSLLQRINDLLHTALQTQKDVLGWRPPEAATPTSHKPARPNQEDRHERQ